MEKLEIITILAVQVALGAAFCVLLMKKWGIAEWMQIHGDRFMSRLFSCDLCMSFWTCAVLSLGLTLFLDDGSLMFIPIFATPVTRMLV